jgi:hypothetical protein
MPETRRIELYENVLLQNWKRDEDLRQTNAEKVHYN